MRQLAGSTPRPWPERWISSRVEDREYENVLGIDAIEHGIRKARDVGTPDFPMNPAKCLGKPFDCIEARINRRDEFFPQAGALLFIPPICPSQIPPNLAAVHDR